MNTFTLLDVISIEYSLGDKMLCDNNTNILTHINNTCKIFNEITKNEIKVHEVEHYKEYIPKKIEEIIEHKMFSILKNPRNVNVYKEPEDYDVDLEKLAKKINDNNYDIILEKVIKKYKYYIQEYYINDTDFGWIFNADREGCSYMFGILMNEYSQFIEKHMKYEISKKDFDEEEHDLYDIIRMSNEH
jgi:hypothetical protein